MSDLIFHNSQGEGPAVLLLNGGMMTASSWEPVASALRGSYRLITCDFRGQLFSPGDGHPTLEAHAADVESMLDHLEVAEVDVVGTSFGAEVGLVLAATAPQRVRSLLAFTATDVTTPSMRRGVAELHRMVDEILEGRAEKAAFFDFLFAEIHSRDYLEANAELLEQRKALSSQLPASWYAGLRGILDCTEQIDLRPLLGSIACPTLILGASDDHVMPVEHSKALADGIPSAALEIREDVGHALILEDSDWLAERCKRFLDSQRSRAK